MTASEWFFIYCANALIVGGLAILWGSQQKILGAALIFFSIVITNVVFLVFGYLIPHIRILIFSYMAMDLILAYIFMLIFRDTSMLRRNRWAGVLAVIQIIMVGVNFAGVMNEEFGRSGTHSIALNVLVIAAFVACLTGFSPKSKNEAWGVLRMKWLALKNSYFRFRVANSEGALRKKENSDDAYNKFLGARIRELRKNAELSLDELSDIFQITRSHLHRIEVGEVKITATFLFRVSQYFDRDMNYFVEGANALIEEAQQSHQHDKSKIIKDA